jgi:leader peptidase (prepilin peptidase) / N-methyltransferase
MQFADTLATHSTLFIGVCVVVGLLVGSFLNVVIHRVPIMMERALRAECAEVAALDARASAEAGTPEVEAPDPEAGPATQPPYNLVVPRSACPHCKAPITAMQNVPVVSWLALRGKCASCRAPISARYPVVELVTGLLTGLAAWHFGYGLPAAGAIVFTWFLIALTMIDFDTKYLPDQLTYPLLWLGLLMSLSHPVWSPYAEPVSPADSILGAVFGYLALWSVYWLFKLITNKEGMGYGDFKLLAALGAWLGWQMLLPIILLSSLAGSVIGIGILVRKKLGKDTEMPFGPYLATAGWIALVFGHQLVSQYFALTDWFAAKL